MNAVQEYGNVVAAIYGVYLDATVGFEFLRLDMQKRQLETIELIKEKFPQLANQEHMDSAWLMYGTEDPNSPKGPPLHTVTQKQFKERNSPHGQNNLFIGNMALVAIYQYWEDGYRARIAQLMKIEKKELVAPIMGDLRWLRTSIVHHSGIALREVKRCELLKWFEEGDLIYIDYDQFKTIVGHIDELLASYQAKLRE